MPDEEQVISMQDIGHPEGHDYEAGSPHLSHSRLRSWVITSLRSLIAEQFARIGRVRVLEIGAGHGAFTDHLLAAGASVTVTEMSQSSAALLSNRYENNPAVNVIFDTEGDAIDRLGEMFDIIVCASVLHHIPDYVGAIQRWADIIQPGGAFASFQDPLWYPRRSRRSMIADRGAYFIWRAGRGDLVEGLKTRFRRLRGTYDETNPYDMVEYHVIRQGCDEQAIANQLRKCFGSVAVIPYWSTQSLALQNVGDRLHARSTFAVIARDRTAEPRH